MINFTAVFKLNSCKFLSDLIQNISHWEFLFSIPHTANKDPSNSLLTVSLSYHYANNRNRSRTKPAHRTDKNLSNLNLFDKKNLFVHYIAI